MRILPNTLKDEFINDGCYLSLVSFLQFIFNKEVDELVHKVSFFLHVLCHSLEHPRKNENIF